MRYSAQTFILNAGRRGSNSFDSNVEPRTKWRWRKKKKEKEKKKSKRNPQTDFLRFLFDPFLSLSRLILIIITITITTIKFILIGSSPLLRYATLIELNQSRILRSVLPSGLEISPIPVEIEPTAIFCICLQLHLLQSRPRVCQRPHANC